MPNKKISMIFRFMSIFLAILISGCAIISKTEIKTFDTKFSRPYENNLGIIKFDTYTIKPLSGRDFVAFQFGLIGSLAAVAMKATENSADYSIEKEDIALHLKSLKMLSERFSSSDLPPITDINLDSEVDIITLSRHIRNLQLYGSNSPSRKEISEYSNEHDLDYILYGINQGGVIENRKKLFLSTDWYIYDSNGREKVSIFTRSVEDKISLKDLNPKMKTDKLLALFSENIERLFIAIKNSGPKKQFTTETLAGF